MSSNPRRQFLHQGLQQGLHCAVTAAGLGLAANPANGANSSAATALRQHPEGRPFRVLMISYRGTTDVDRGFQAFLTEAGLDVHYTLRDVAQDVARLPAVLEEVPALRPDLIYTWGTPITLGVVGAYDQAPRPGQVHDVPVVFALVAEPQRARIVQNLQAPERNVTGAVHVVPLDTQMRLMRNYRAFDKVGVLYNASEPNSQAIVEQMRQNPGLRNGLVARTFARDEQGRPTADGVEALIAEIKAAGAQWLYLLPDTFLGTIYDRVSPAALGQQLPTFGAAELAVRSGGALAGLVSRYFSVGQLAGAKAVDLLAGGKRPRDVPVDTLKRFSLLVNMQTARQLQLYPPLELLNYAEVIAVGPGSRGVTS